MYFYISKTPSMNYKLYFTRIHTYNVFQLNSLWTHFFLFLFIFLYHFNFLINYFHSFYYIHNIYIRIFNFSIYNRCFRTLFVILIFHPNSLNMYNKKKCLFLEKESNFHDNALSSMILYTLQFALNVTAHLNYRKCRDYGYCTMLRSFFKMLRSYRKKDISNVNYIYYFVHPLYFLFNYILHMQRFIIIIKKVDIFLFVIFFTLNEILFEILRRKTIIYVTFMNVFRLRQLHSLEINGMTVNA